MLNYSKFHIDVVIKDDDISKKDLTEVYEHLDTACRFETWNLIRSLCRMEEKTWLVFGDFNEIPYQNEKLGGRNRPDKQMHDFIFVLTNYALRDLRFGGAMYTWCNRR